MPSRMTLFISFVPNLVKNKNARKLAQCSQVRYKSEPGIGVVSRRSLTVPWPNHLRLTADCCYSCCGWTDTLTVWKRAIPRGQGAQYYAAEWPGFAFRLGYIRQLGRSWKLGSELSAFCAWGTVAQRDGFDRESGLTGKQLWMLALCGWRRNCGIVSLAGI